MIPLCCLRLKFYTFYLNVQGTFLHFSVIFLCFNSPFKSLCVSENLTSRNTCVFASERLDASISSTSLTNPRASFATHTTKWHANSQSRRSSASVSPVEELLERIQWSTKNSPLCHSETFSRVANVTSTDNTAYAQTFHPSPHEETFSTGIRLRSLLNRYSFLRSFISVFCNLYNPCLSFCSLFDMPCSPLSHSC